MLLAIPDSVARSIAADRADAALIPWGPRNRQKRDPALAIESSKAMFALDGWLWNEARRQLEKDGWYLWYRSQGQLAPPIAQWNRL